MTCSAHFLTSDPRTKFDPLNAEIWWRDGQVNCSGRRYGNVADIIVQLSSRRLDGLMTWWPDFSGTCTAHGHEKQYESLDRRRVNRLDRSSIPPDCANLP